MVRCSSRCYPDLRNTQSILAPRQRLASAHQNNKLLAVDFNVPHRKLECDQVALERPNVQARAIERPYLRVPPISTHPHAQVTMGGLPGRVKPAEVAARGTECDV